MISLFSFLWLISTGVTISFIGDCTIGSDARNPHFDPWVKEKGYDYFFSGVKHILEQDDYTLANLETTITDSGTPVKKRFRFKGKPDYLNILKEGNVECVTVANNHTWDYSDYGYAQTGRYLDSFGIDFFGYSKILIKEIKGIRFAFIGQSFDLEDSTIQRIKEIRDSTDFIIVAYHWGIEGTYKPNKEQRALAHSLIDAGADLIIGHHPHVLQPIECYRGKYIAYSLGNFVFGGNKNPREKNTMILQATFIKGEKITLKKYPCRISSVDSINDFRPKLKE